MLESADAGEKYGTPVRRLKCLHLHFSGTFSYLRSGTLWNVSEPLRVSGFVSRSELATGG